MSNYEIAKLAVENFEFDNMLPLKGRSIMKM